MRIILGRTGDGVRTGTQAQNGTTKLLGGTVGHNLAKLVSSATLSVVVATSLLESACAACGGVGVDFEVNEDEGAVVCEGTNADDNCGVLLLPPAQFVRLAHAAIVTLGASVYAIEQTPQRDTIPYHRVTTIRPS